MYNTIIIGGGAAGLFAAANIEGRDTLLLEGTKKLGQKLLISGGGMCNITNMDDIDTFLSHFGSKKQINFLKPALFNLSTEKTRDYLNSIDLELTVREDGKVFPKSLKAQTVIDHLHREITKNGNKIKYNTKVKKIKTTDNIFTISTSKESFQCLNLIVATGGKSFPETGSDGSMYSLLSNIGCKLVPTTPALAGIKIQNYPFKTLSGNSVRNCNIDFYKPGETKRYLTAKSDLLFTHQGVSGPVILNNSRNIDNNDILYISLISCDNKESKRTEILNAINGSIKNTTKRFLKELGLTSSMVDLLSKNLRLELNSPIKSLNKEVKKELLNNLLNFPLKVSSKIGFNGAMVTAGGIDISNIDRKTMMSKEIPGLYFAGEVLDIDGDTGGYNIQAAFSTAKLVADNLNRQPV